MNGAKDREENIAAASSATVQQAGIALGAAIAGLIANSSGLGNTLDLAAVVRASLWVPLSLTAAARRVRDRDKAECPGGALE
jgi:predicted MFS family arabinose efflux permease